MYERFYGLRERPFDLTPNPTVPGADAGHREALSNLEYAIASRKGITLLVGEAGIGQDDADPRRDRAVSRARALRAPAQPGADARRVRRDARHAVRVERQARARRRARCCTSSSACFASGARPARQRVLIVDEAQSLPLELLEEIRLLANIETNDEKLLSVIIAGQPELADA